MKRGAQESVLPVRAALKGKPERDPVRGLWKEPSTFPTQSECISLLLLPSSNGILFHVRNVHIHITEEGSGSLFTHSAPLSLSLLPSSEASGAPSQVVVSIE